MNATVLGRMKVACPEGLLGEAGVASGSCEPGEETGLGDSSETQRRELAVGGVVRNHIEKASAA